VETIVGPIAASVAAIAITKIEKKYSFQLATIKKIRKMLQNLYQLQSVLKVQDI
jgi:hypothetical protein